MADRIAYFNGKYINESEVKISMKDRGFANGDAAFDVARTFNHRPFRWKEHIDRWFSSLRYIQIDIGMTPEEVYDITLQVFKRNEQVLGPGDDYTVWWVGTPGEDHFRVPLEPTVLIYGHPVGFKSFARQYIDGVHVVIVSNRAIPPQCLDPKAKLHSRAHNVLADLEAKSVDPDAYALLLDVSGHIAECTRQNIFLVRKEKLLTPTRNNILEGVTRATTLELAKELGIETLEMDLSVYDLYNADEIFLTWTSRSISPVSKIDNRPLKRPIPGPITQKLISAWSEMVGMDIVEQCVSQLKSGD